MSLREDVHQLVETLPEDGLREVAEFIQRRGQNETSPIRHLGTLLDEIAAGMSYEDTERLPRDGAANHDPSIEEVTKNTPTDFSGQIDNYRTPRTPEKGSDNPTPNQSISDLMAYADRLAATLPEEERQNVPADFTRQLDHYIYGTPKE